MLLTSSTPKTLRHPRTVLILGLLFLVLAIVFPRLADAIHLPLAADARDTVHGFLFGISFGLLLLSLFVRARQRD